MGIGKIHRGGRRGVGGSLPVYAEEGDFVEQQPIMSHHNKKNGHPQKGCPSYRLPPLIAVIKEVGAGEDVVILGGLHHEPDLVHTKLQIPRNTVLLKNLPLARNKKRKSNFTASLF